MTVDISARGPEGKREFTNFYRKGIDPQSLRILVEALKPLLPDESVYPAADEDEWLFYGVLANDLHPDSFNAAMATLRASHPAVSCL